MFMDRHDAGHQLGTILQQRTWRDPVVLGIPRGGVVVAAEIARMLNAELDVILARKLGAPTNPEYAIGAVDENGDVFMNPTSDECLHLSSHYLSAEREVQFEALTRRRKRFRQIRPAAPIKNRSVIVVDDGIATGSTMSAALRIVQEREPFEVVVASPVACTTHLDYLNDVCDDRVILLMQHDCPAVACFYEDFSEVTDDEVCDLLKAGALAG